MREAGDRDLDHAEPGPDRVDRHRRLHAEPAGERPDGGQARRRSARAARRAAPRPGSPSSSRIAARRRTLHRSRARRRPAAGRSRSPCPPARTARRRAASRGPRRSSPRSASANSQTSAGGSRSSAPSRARPCPAWPGIRSTVAPAASAAADVPSDEPSSTTTTSSSREPAERRRPCARPSSSSSRAGTRATTRDRVAPSCRWREEPRGAVLHAVVAARTVDQAPRPARAPARTRRSAGRCCRPSRAARRTSHPPWRGDPSRIRRRTRGSPRRRRRRPSPTSSVTNGSMNSLGGGRRLARDPAGDHHDHLAAPTDRRQRRVRDARCRRGQEPLREQLAQHRPARPTGRRRDPSPGDPRASGRPRVVSTSGGVVCDSPSSVARSALERRRCPPPWSGGRSASSGSRAPERSSARRVCRERARPRPLPASRPRPAGRTARPPTRYGIACIAERVHRVELRLQVLLLLLELVADRSVSPSVWSLRFFTRPGLTNRRPHEHAQPEREEDRHDRDQVIPPARSQQLLQVERTTARTARTARSKYRRSDGEIAVTTTSIASERRADQQERVAGAQPESRRVDRATRLSRRSRISPTRRRTRNVLAHPLAALVEELAEVAVAADGDDQSRRASRARAGTRRPRSCRRTWTTRVRDAERVPAARRPGARPSV